MSGGAHLHLVRPDAPTRVVAIGGGHGLAASLRAIRNYANEITAVVSVADDGGSTGRLRAVGDRPAPGDLRKSLVALADESFLAQAMEHRFQDGELHGHALGNLLLIGLVETSGDLVGALEEMGRLLGTVGRVLPATNASVRLRGSTTAGEVIDGQVEIGKRSDLSTVSLIPESTRVCAEAVLEIASADQIVLGPGSLYTSVLAATAVPGLAQAVSEADGQFVYVCNLHPQIPETEGYDVADHVRALERHGLVPDVVLYDPSTIAGAEGVSGAVKADLAKESGLAHDPQLLGKALASVLA